MGHNKSYSYSNPALAVCKAGRYALGNRGFTLVELIVTTAIIGVLALMAIPAYAKIKDMVRSVRAVEEIRGLEKTITAYSIDHGGALPADNAALGNPIDPWGRDYRYHPMAASVPLNAVGTPDGSYTPRTYVSQLNSDFDLYSSGPDGASEPSGEIDTGSSLDDIMRTGNGGFVGKVLDLVLAP